MTRKLENKTLTLKCLAHVIALEDDELSDLALSIMGLHIIRLALRESEGTRYEDAVMLNDAEADTWANPGKEMKYPTYKMHMNMNLRATLYYFCVHYPGLVISAT